MDFYYLMILFFCIFAKNRVMAKQKIEKTNAARLLDRAKIAYELIPYEVDENNLAATHVAEELGAIIGSWQFGKFGTVVAICVITCFMGMVIPGSSLVVIFGPMFITTLAAVGCDALLVAAMLPCICGVMCGITPPLGLGMYAGMTLAESDFDKTFKNNLWWVFAQFFLEVVVLMGWLPILGL